MQGCMGLTAGLSSRQDRAMEGKWKEAMSLTASPSAYVLLCPYKTAMQPPTFSDFLTGNMELIDLLPQISTQHSRAPGKKAKRENGRQASFGIPGTAHSSRVLLGAGRQVPKIPTRLAEECFFKGQKQIAGLDRGPEKNTDEEYSLYEEEQGGFKEQSGQRGPFTITPPMRFPGSCSPEKVIAIKEVTKRGHLPTCLTEKSNNSEEEDILEAKADKDCTNIKNHTDNFIHANICLLFVNAKELLWIFNVQETLRPLPRRPEPHEEDIEPNQEGPQGTNSEVPRDLAEIRFQWDDSAHSALSLDEAPTNRPTEKKYRNPGQHPFTDSTAASDAAGVKEPVPCGGFRLGGYVRNYNLIHRPLLLSRMKEVIAEDFCEKLYEAENKSGFSLHDPAEESLNT
ncbi:hypothetical protein H920_13816 [Fukomys damarensis]|uniref:Uncharacterized protein n=1 Tax=Fukomys damarensis TaxID=885580 RepID=A0A091D3N4_FUKDA|nr:hypothetical protein H920_13816 [Fukomys damarensis]